MSRKRPSEPAIVATAPDAGYEAVLAGIVHLLEAARRQSARAVNAVMTATYWEVGRRIMEHEQRGARRAEYGEELLKRLAADLTGRFGRGFSKRNLEQMRLFYASFPIAQTVSAQSGARANAQTLSAHSPDAAHLLPVHSKSQTASAESSRSTWSSPAGLRSIIDRFPLPWSHYVRLLAVRNSEGRRFYETEALRGGWTVRQLDRQVSSQFYERTAASRNKAAMLRRGERPQSGDAFTPEEELKDPYVLEFLGLKDEYSESEVEDALIRHLESFLLELGGDFAFVARQRRLRIGRQWYRVDLLFYHRRLRCLVIIDLKLGSFDHADAGQMHLYLNYARAHWTHTDENPPVGLILCAERDAALARYALEGLPSRVIAAEYRTALPDEALLAAEIQRTRRALEQRRTPAPNQTHRRGERS